MSVTKRPNGAWRARILGPDGKERARHFPTRAAAKRWEAEQSPQCHISGSTPSRSVRPSEVQAWITERSLFLPPGTLRLLLRLWNAIYNSAVLDRLVATSPCYASPCPPTNR